MEQVIIGGQTAGTEPTVIRYNSLYGGAEIWSSVEQSRQQIISTSGKIKKLHVRLDGTPGAGKSYTFILRVDGSDTALACTISDSETSGQDLVDEITVSPGQLVGLKCNPSGTPTKRAVTWSVVFEGDNANESLLLGTEGTNSKTGTEYNAVTGYAGWSTPEGIFRQVCPTSGVIKNLYVSLRDDPGTAPDAYEFTLRVNGADSDDGGNPLQVTIVANDITGNNTAQNISVSAGDILTMKCTPISSPSVAVMSTCSMTFVADIDGESLILGGPAIALDETATEYSTLAGRDGWRSTESEALQLAQACTLKKFYVLLDGPPASDKNYTFTVRLEEASPGSGLVVVITSASATGNDVSNTIDVLDGNTLDLMSVPFNTPGVRKAYWGLVSFIAPPAGLENKSANMAAKMMGIGAL